MVALREKLGTWGSSIQDQGEDGERKTAPVVEMRHFDAAVELTAQQKV